MPSFHSKGLFSLILSLFLLITPSFSFAFQGSSQRLRSSDDSLPYPVIGLLTQPSPYSTKGYPSTEFSYVPASYVKHLESAGATVVPIQWDMPTNELDVLLGKLNGVLFPGGGSTIVVQKSSLSLFGQAGAHIVEKALEFNNNGDFFPVWGTCLGFELLVVAISGNMTLLTNVAEGDDVAKTLVVTQDGESGLYAGMDPSLLSAIQNTNLSYFHHKHTPDPAGWTNDANLASNFSVSAWTVDPVSGQYAATIQGKAHPFFGVQFHPEKNVFEWESTTQIPHSLEASFAQQYYAYFLANETLKSSHRFDSESDLEEFWIYNTKPKHFGPNPEFEQVYLFENYQTYSPDTPLIDEYPKGYEPRKQETKTNVEVPEFEETFKFKEAAPFLFTREVEAKWH